MQLENCGAKRRRRSGNSQSLQQDQKTQVLNTQQHVVKPSLCHSDSSQQSGGGGCGSDMVTMAEEEGPKVSVVEMVAFLEQRASKQQPDCKPMLGLQKSSTTITLSRAPPSVVRDRSEVKGEEPESIKVSDMVAKLESECLRRRTEGDLSRSNSLRRSVGRVLLVAGDKTPAPSRPTSQLSSVTSSSLSLLVGAQSQSREPISCTETARTKSPASAQTTPPPLRSGEPVVEPQEAGGGVGLQTHSAVSAQTVVTPPLSEEAEPLPGLLFLTSPPADSYPPADLDPCPLTHNMTFDLEAAHSQSFHPSVSSTPHSGSQLEKRQRRRANSSLEEEAGVSLSLAAVPVSRHVSQDFLEMRQRLQQLLEPQPYLAVLPHHLLVKIFLLLPTQSLAALKCTCHYFKFVIENYGVRPADSLWVSDPRYRDDPCKQCKKRYGRGDVSLCRWHHKPYCQALPYGPGYWMCCHGAHRDTPGCNVGLHDNRWVPAFHSINVPIYRRSRDEDD
uniref:F-box protein 34 n=1 Tax=Mastacembelus armatus TaxID=205130 RepID=A0A3Q3L6X5_9TELE